MHGGLLSFVLHPHKPEIQGGDGNAAMTVRGAAVNWTRASAATSTVATSASAVMTGMQEKRMGADCTEIWSYRYTSKNTMDVMSMTRYIVTLQTEMTSL